VTKDGNLAGPKLLEHLVDVVLSIDGDRHHGHRVLRATKNRYGSTQEIGLFEMTAEGLCELESAGASISPDGPLVSGSVLVATMAGSRCLPAEVQALSSAGFLGSATRRATGLDSNRLAMLIAVLEKHGGVRLADQNIFAAATGGLRIVEPAADLAVALAVAGAFRGQGIDPATVVLGEIGLTGSLRSVSQVEQRVRELARRGARRAILPSQQASAAVEAGLEVVGVDRVADALGELLPTSELASSGNEELSKKLNVPAERV
jgi:DNA repair protein RadA/Sms